jgi:hypothetical protein
MEALMLVPRLRSLRTETIAETSNGAVRDRRVRWRNPRARRGRIIGGSGGDAAGDAGQKEPDLSAPR